MFMYVNINVNSICVYFIKPCVPNIMNKVEAGFLYIIIVYEKYYSYCSILHQ